jgi:hypothetical protein
MTLTKEEREQGYTQPPAPAWWAQLILRRIAGGYLLLTLDGDGGTASYDDGTAIIIPHMHNKERRTRQMTGNDVKLWVKRGWLIPIEGEALFPGAPPQRYRSRTVADGPLPRLIKPDGRPLWAIPPT